MRLLRLSPLLALSLIVGFACGGEDLSRAEYIKKADAICGRDKPPEVKPTPRIQDQAPQLEKLIEYREGVLDDLEDLEPPDEIEKPANTYIDAGRETNEFLRREVEAAKKGDLIEFQDIDVEASLASARRVRAAVETGFRVCGQPTDGPPNTVETFAHPKLRQADQICQAANEDIVANKPKDQGLKSLGEANAENVAPQEQALKKIKALEVPKEDRKLWGQFLEVFEERVGNVKKLADAGRAGDQKAFDRTAQEDGRAYGKENELATKLGLLVCGQASPLGM